ncbi:MAG TPA: S41 family peptidase [Alphaproteobacteria bacterium]|nr:S41 family peptidase [Alphaproteobacteria bacterium]
MKRGDQEPFDVQVTRDRVVPAVVEGKLIDGMGTAGIKFTSFNEQTVPQFIKTMIRLANEAHDNAMKADDSRKTLRVILPDFSGNGGGLKDVAEITNDLLIDNEKEGCLRITASGKNNMEDLVCADSRYGPQIFEAVSEVAAVLFRGQGDDANSIYTYSALIYPWQVAKTLPPMTKVGTFETLSGRPQLEDQLFLGLNNANIFEVLKRLALSGAKDSAGNILVPIDVIENIEGRAKLEKKFAADLHQVPGLQLKSKMPDTGEKLTVPFVPAARQNSGSASASEITTGNLQDQKVAIIGESHGKGSVQVMFPIDAEGNFTRTGPNDPPQAALQKFTTGGFFPGQSGLSNHGSEGVPADILIENGDFRDEREKNAPREVNGLIPDDMKRHPSADRLQCSLKPAFRGTLGEARKKTLPEYMVTTVLNENEETGEIERVEVADTALACALAQVTGEKETAFVTIGPAPAPELKAP